MAIVAEGVAANGARYRIDDSVAARPGTEEYRRRAEAACRAAYRILTDYARRMEAQGNGERDHASGAADDGGTP